MQFHVVYSRISMFSRIQFLHENELILPCSLIVQDFQRNIWIYKTYFNLWNSEEAQQHNRHETTTAIEPQSQKLKVLAQYVKNMK